MKASSTQTEVFNQKDGAINESFLSQTETEGQLTARLYSNRVKSAGACSQVRSLGVSLVFVITPSLVFVFH